MFNWHSVGRCCSDAFGLLFIPLHLIIFRHNAYFETKITSSVCRLFLRFFTNSGWVLQKFRMKFLGSKCSFGSNECSWIRDEQMTIQQCMTHSTTRRGLACLGPCMEDTTDSVPYPEYNFIASLGFTYVFVVGTAAMKRNAFQVSQISFFKSRWRGSGWHIVSCESMRLISFSKFLVLEGSLLFLFFSQFGSSTYFFFSRDYWLRWVLYITAILIQYVDNLSVCLGVAGAVSEKRVNWASESFTKRANAVQVGVYPGLA